MNENMTTQTIFSHISTASSLANAQTMQRCLSTSGKSYLTVLDDPEAESYFVATVAEPCALVEAGYELFTGVFIGALPALLARLAEWGVQDVDPSGSDQLCLNCCYAAETTGYDAKLLELLVLRPHGLIGPAREEHVADPQAQAFQQKGGRGAGLQNSRHVQRFFHRRSLCWAVCPVTLNAPSHLRVEGLRGGEVSHGPTGRGGANFGKTALAATCAASQVQHHSSPRTNSKSSPARTRMAMASSRASRLSSAVGGVSPAQPRNRSR